MKPTENDGRLYHQSTFMKEVVKLYHETLQDQSHGHPAVSRLVARFVGPWLCAFDGAIMYD